MRYILECVSAQENKMYVSSSSEEVEAHLLNHICEDCMEWSNPTIEDMLSTACGSEWYLECIEDDN